MPDTNLIHLEEAHRLRRENKPLAALEAYAAVIHAAPDLADAYIARGALLADLRAFDQALVDQQRAIELSPGDIAPRFALVRTLQAKGDFAGAERCCRDALAMEDQSAHGWELLGCVMQTTGRFAEAADCFRRSLAIQPSGAVSMLLAQMPGQNDSADMRRLIDLLARPELSVVDRVAAGFALGNLLDDADRYDEAFAACSSANALFKEWSAGQGHRFEFEALKRLVDESIETFTPQFFQDRSDFGQPSELPVFIVGMPRSGTSLVEQIAASHSRVFGAGELTEIGLIRQRLAGMDPADAPRHWHRHSARVHLGKLALMGGDALRVTDKMPANLLYLGLINVLFPTARIIFCQRDPRDTCLSCFFQKFDKHNLMFSYDLADCARQHHEMDRLTAHWQRVLPLRMLTVQYEQLVGNLESQSRRLIDFLGLDWEPGCMDFHRTNRPVLTRSVWQVRQPIYSRSVGRWKRYEKHLPASLLAKLAGPKLPVAGFTPDVADLGEACLRVGIEQVD